MNVNELITSANYAFSQLLNVIETEIFLSNSYQLKPMEIVVTDPQLAVMYATNQDIELPFQYWTNILENHEIYYSDIMLLLDGKGRAVTVETDNLSTQLMHASQLKINAKKLPSPIQDVICGDFEVFLRQLTFDQTLKPFNANLLRIYREGGFPCGWKGDYPKGEQLVYVHTS